MSIQGEFTPDLYRSLRTKVDDRSQERTPYNLLAQDVWSALLRSDSDRLTRRVRALTPAERAKLRVQVTGLLKVIDGVGTP